MGVQDPVGPRVRRARPADAAAVAGVQVRTWQAAYREIVPDRLLDAMEADAGRVARWQGILADAAAVAFVAHAAGAVVGFAVGGRARDADPRFPGELQAVYVLPEWQRRGAGAELVRAVAAALASEGAHAMKVWVLERNPSRAFYERLGGVPCGRRREVREGGSVVLDEVAYGFALPLRPEA